MKPGDLTVWWNPQVGSTTTFFAPIESVEEGAKILQVLAEYDKFQFENNVKPDYCNAGGLARWCEDNGEGVPGWEDWYDEETGTDDPLEYLEGKAA